MDNETNTLSTNKNIIKRKRLRLIHYDYSQNGCYFVTVCTKERKPLLGTIVQSMSEEVYIDLTRAGTVTDKYINTISEIYEKVSIDKYVIMPNHIHMIMSNEQEETITNKTDERITEKKANISTIIGALKRLTAKETGITMWQTSYYDRIIRNQKEYDEIWKYIDENIQKWNEDELMANHM